MITVKDIYEVLSALIPLYAAMSLAYASVRWWKIFTLEQCAGINRFVAVFAIPLLSFKLIAFNNPYTMNLKLIIADTLQKIVVIAGLFLWTTLFRRNKSSLDWIITLNSLSTLPNTLVMGIPLLRAMYGEFSTALVVQIVVFQGVIWYTLLLIMFEYRAAKLFISENFPQRGGSIASFEVESDIVSLATGDEDHNREALHAEVAEIDSSGRFHVVVKRNSCEKFPELGHAMSAMPRVSNVMGVEICSLRSSVETPRISSFNEAAANFAKFKSRSTSMGSLDKDHFHMFVSVNQRNQLRHALSCKGFSTVPTDLHDHVTTKKESASSNDNGSKGGIGFDEKDGEDKQQMPSASVMTKLILTMVWRKLVRNPNTYASIIGIVWSLISFRWNIGMPLPVQGCIRILSDTGLGMSMFSLGLFMALQPKIIACGKFVTMLSLAVRFLVGPAVMAATSFAIGIRGVLLQVSIVQAALPQAIVSFVFAKEYNVHPQILSTSVTIGMVVALPITILYYVLLGL